MKNDKYVGNLKSSLAYSKPYSKKIASLKMSIDYFPPKLKQFDGIGNLKQHLKGHLLVKQFVRSLKGSTFNWYIELAHGSIDI